MARTILAHTVKVDNTWDVMAAHVNLLQINQEKIWNTLTLVEATELTIDAAGAITVTQNYHTVDTLADAASDNLDTINLGANVEEGTILIIRPDHTARTIVVRHGIDNILCNGNADIHLEDSHDFAFLIYDETLTAWMAFGGSAELVADLTPQLGGDLDLNGHVITDVVVSDTTPQLGGNLDLNDFSIEATIEPAADETPQGIIADVTVDSNSTGIGCPLYIAADGHWDEADADTIATAPCFALALEAGTGTKKVLFHGLMRLDAWNWTTGPGEISLIYLSETVGELTQTPPTTEDAVVQPVAYAVSDDMLYWNPSLIYIEHGA